MKNKNLLLLTIPAMLMAVSCGSSVDHNTMDALKTATPPSNGTMVSIACRNCVMDLGEGVIRDTLEYEYDVGASLEFDLYANNDGVSRLPTDVDFQIGHESATIGEDYQYIIDRDATSGTLSFDVPSESVTVIIDATTNCVEFTINADYDDVVTFGYNGSIDKVDWGDGMLAPIVPSRTHQYTVAGEYTARIYGDVSSIWFTDRASNSAVLDEGNNHITSLSINHTVKSLPDYGFNGCEGLEKVYIGESVVNIGRNVFKLGDEESVDFHPTVIYARKTEQPSTWLKGWTDCPVIYGIVSDIRGDYKDSNFDFKIIIDPNGQRAAMISGIDKNHVKPDQISDLVIPSTLNDGDVDIPVYGIAPFAFSCDNELPNLESISFAENSGYFTEFGDYSFFGSDYLSSIDLSNTSNIGLSSNPFRFGRCSFKNTDFFESITFPTFVKNTRELIIDDEAFMNSWGASYSFYVPDDSFKITEVGDRAFYYSCCNSFNFQDSLTSIGEEAFYDSYLDSEDSCIFIPSSVRQIGARAFYNTYLYKVLVMHENKPSGWSDDWDVYYIDDESGEIDKLIVKWGFVKQISDSYGFIYDIYSKKGTKFAAVVNYMESDTEPRVPGIVIDPDNPKNIYSVTEISDYAFQSCEWIIDITLPESITKIGERAFEGCTSLDKVMINSTDVVVGAYAFNYCDPFLKVFYKGSNISNWDENWATTETQQLNYGPALYTNYDSDIPAKELDSRFTLAKERESENDPTYNASILDYNAPDTPEKVNIPATLTGQKGEEYVITSIGGKSFFKPTIDEDGMIVPGTGVDLTNGVEFARNSQITSIGLGAFSCTQLPANGMQLPSSVTDVGDFAYAGIKIDAKEGTLDFSKNSNITKFGKYAFAYSIGLVNVTFPENKSGKNIQIGEGAFANSKIINADLSNTHMTNIPSALFYGCENYTTVNLPDDVGTIGEEAFARSGVNAVDLSNCSKLSSIGRMAFAECQHLTSIKLPANFTAFAPGAFASIPLPKPQKSNGCPVLETIDLSAVDTVVDPGIGGFDDPRLFDIELNRQWNIGGAGKIIVKSKELMEKYINDVRWIRTLGGETSGDISSHFVLPR